MHSKHRTFRDHIRSQHSIFLKKLVKGGMSTDTAVRIITSGYHMLNNNMYGNNSGEYFHDSYYGYGFKCDFQFIEDFPSNNGINMDRRIRSGIRSVADAYHAVEDVVKDLNPDIAKRVCYRGECRKRTMLRQAPNPFYCYSDGSELLMLPSYWRQYRDSEYMDRPLIAEYEATLGNSIFSDLILYDGIDIIKLSEYNHKTYGIHTMDDLADFPEPENQEVYRRYSAKRDYAFGTNECISLEQHYGCQTTHLDVTFDLPTALFFALNKFEILDGSIPSATYTRDYRENSNPTVFCFLFPSEDVYYERDKITRYTRFPATPPLRPIRQNCAVFRTDALEFNWAAKHVILELKLEKDFCTEGLPDYEYLFPSSKHDKFYAKLLEQKHQFPEVWEEIIEYK